MGMVAGQNPEQRRGTLYAAQSKRADQTRKMAETGHSHIDYRRMADALGHRRGHHLTIANDAEGRLPGFALDREQRAEQVAEHVRAPRPVGDFRHQGR